MPTEPLTFISLFAGIGGFDLGLERAGMQCVAQVEIDDYAQRVLAKHWPTVPRFRDVRSVGAHNLPHADLMCGGFPCQDISIAGRRAGLTGERSGLWGEFARLIGELRPRYVLVENVSNLLSGERGAWMGAVLGDLAALGYDTEWQVLPAAAFGAPHERERLFLVAYPGGKSERRGIVFHTANDISRNEQWRAAQGVASGRGWKRWLVQACADMDRAGHNPWFRGVADGLSCRLDKIRLKGLGNAVVPQVAEFVGRAIVAHARAEAEQHKRAA